MSNNESGNKIIQALNDGVQYEQPRHYDPVQQIMLGAIRFWDTYQYMKNRNLKGFDGYTHAFANAEATKLGTYGEKTAEFLSGLKELHDALKHSGKQPTIDLVFDIQADIDADKYGREQAKKYPNAPTHELLQKYWVKDETGQIAK